MMANAYQQYQTNAVLTATPAELTLLLYNGAIKFGNQAIDTLEKGELEKSHNANIKVQNIITELQATLDEKYEISKELDRLYDFIKSLLIQGNIEKNAEKIADAVDLIREFRDMWQETMKLVK